jgi:endonuclease YncB( thermonuclease family)
MRPPSYGLALGLLCLIAAPSVRAAELTGIAVYTVDGDTFDLRVGGTDTRIRVCGIDSPERGQPGYRQAKDAMRALVDGKTVRCVQVGGGTPCDGRSKPTNNSRAVAQCFVGDMDIAVPMVRNGHACDWPQFSGGHYQLSAAVCVR